MTSFPVVVQSAGLGELLLTELTPEGFLPAVSPAVSPEGGHVRETPSTESTGVGFLSRVDPHVELQVRLPSKFLITFPKGALERFFSSVDPQVLLEFVFLVENCRTFCTLEGL